MVLQNNGLPFFKLGSKQGPDSNNCFYINKLLFILVTFLVILHIGELDGPEYYIDENYYNNIIYRRF